MNKSILVTGSQEQLGQSLQRLAPSLPYSAIEGKVGETYNIGGHNEKQNIEVVETIYELLENPQWCQHVQDGSYQRDRLGMTEKTG